MDEPWSGLDIGASIYCIDHGGGMGGTIWMDSWNGGGLCIEKVSSSTLRPSLLAPKNSRRDFHGELGNSKSLRATT